MDKLNQFLVKIDGYLGSSNWFPILLLGTGIFFTIYLKFPQIRYFRHALRILSGKYEKDTMPGDTTHFQSLTTALSGTVGTGNIGGVGLALFIGGPAALFWMWVTAFLGMTTKFVECTLSHKYRITSKDGTIAGGPMYYMERGLKMKWLAVLFAIGTIICAFGTGNMPQVNNISTSLAATLDIPPWATGGVLAVLLGLIIIGGIKRIARVTKILVPFMCVVYVSGALLVVITHIDNLIPGLARIFTDIFSGSAATGGFLGSTFGFALTKGVGRGLYSNEAGQGSAAIAHSAAKADEPVSEGMVAILEPFIDTLVICTLTGLTIICSNVWTQKHMNDFQSTDMVIVAGDYADDNPNDVAQLSAFYTGDKSSVKPLNGTLKIDNGHMAEGQAVTVLNARSIAEEMTFSRNGKPISEKLVVQDGIIQTEVTIRGKSLVHSALLTATAFSQTFLGDKGALIVSLGLLLFAFSTVISWSYYGDRAVTYLLGDKFILPYRLLYIIAFFVAALVDTTIVWSLAAIAIVAMTVPNLLGILLLHRDMKRTVQDYWENFKG
ncbi:MAG: sodium:alanine symporter family protein [Deltaproteobacteria bacterium]|nr:sodium:alanine symporter family protein [Deltaproteobacteria bacterium]